MLTNADRSRVKRDVENVLLYTRACAAETSVREILRLEREHDDFVDWQRSQSAERYDAIEALWGDIRDQYTAIDAA